MNLSEKVVPCAVAALIWSGTRSKVRRISKYKVDSHYQLHATLSSVMTNQRVLEGSKLRVDAKTLILLVSFLALAASACGSDGGTNDAESGADGPVIVATTSILGDVVGQLVGDQAEVVTVMPAGADPHDFQPSAREVDALLSASAVIANGENFEEGLVDVIESAVAAGIPTFEAIDAVSTLERSADVHHDEHGDEEDEHEDEDEHDEEDDEHDEAGHSVDPHFFTDPSRMADAVNGIVAFLDTEVDGLDSEALNAAGDEYLAELADVDAEVEQLLAVIPEEQRTLLTNHEVFGYFADRYGFEVVGAVLPGGSTVESASAGELAELAELIESEGVSAIFADTSSSSALADTLAAEVGDVAVVELYSESLGEVDSDGATYVEMIRTNANRIAGALG